MALQVAAATYSGFRDAELFAEYAKAVLRDRREAKAYRLYVAEALRIAPQGKALRHSLADIINGKHRCETESAESIIERVTRNAGLEVRQ